MQPLAIPVEFVRAVALYKLMETLFATRYAGHLRAKVTKDLTGDTDVRCNEVQQGLVGFTFVEQLQKGDPKTLLINFSCVHGHCTGSDTTDLGVMNEGRGIAFYLVFEKNRLDEI